MTWNKKNDPVCLTDRLDFLAGILTMNGGFLRETGLAFGKLGIAIFFYHYAEFTGKKYYDEFAGSLIDDLSEQINISAPLDFETGLTGIGWGISYLLRKGFIEGNIDDILEEIDLAIAAGLKVFFSSGENDMKKISGYDLYMKARRSSQWDGSELISFIEPYDPGDLKMNIPFLIDQENYGLFHGIAGEAFTILSNLTLKKETLVNNVL